MAVEQPRGIRAHLQLAFGSGGSGEVTSDLFDYGSMHGAWKPLLFSLCCFNALVHERRKFGTLGFNLLYDFTSSDLEVIRLRLLLFLFLYMALFLSKGILANYSVVELLCFRFLF